MAHGVGDARVLVFDLVALVQHQHAPRDGVAQRRPEVRAGHHLVGGHRHVEGGGVRQHLHEGGGGTQLQDLGIDWSQKNNCRVTAYIPIGAILYVDIAILKMAKDAIRGDFCQHLNESIGRKWLTPAQPGAGSAMNACCILQTNAVYEQPPGISAVPSTSR